MNHIFSIVRDIKRGVTVFASTAVAALALTGCMTAPQSTSNTSSNNAALAHLTSAGITEYGGTSAEDITVLSQHNDIWGRIRKGFAMPNMDTDAVLARENWYRERPQYFAQTGKRAERYLYHIVEELEKRNMPTELALLPFLESAYNPAAVSHAQAAGMWQFIPSTGRGYKLQQDMLRDERRDVIASTDAALDYLQKLHGMFGDWHLALAAYNWGEGNVLRAINNNKKLDLGTDYLSLTLPNETQGYVPTLQALKNVVINPKQYDIELPLIQDIPFFQTHAIQKDIDIEMIAKLATISKEEFKALNPAINTPVVLAVVTPNILLPQEKMAIFETNLSLCEEPLATWTVWKTPSTMNITQAAQATRMSAKVLQEVNALTANARLKQGSTLIVRRTESQQKNVQLAQIKNVSLDLVNEKNSKNNKKTAKGNTIKSAKANTRTGTKTSGKTTAKASTKTKNAEIKTAVLGSNIPSKRSVKR